MRDPRQGFAMIAMLAFTALMGGLASLAFMANTRLIRENHAYAERLQERAGEVVIVVGGTQGTKRTAGMPENTAPVL